MEHVYPSIGVGPVGLALAVAAALPASPAAAGEAHFAWLPGAAREIPRTRSAGRDAPVFEYAYGPAAQSSLGGEWAWLLVEGGGVTFRLGSYGMIGMENVEKKAPFPPGGELWRGMAGASAAVSLDAVARRALGEGGALEVALLFGHESGHGDLDAPREPDDLPVWKGMQFLQPDAAVRIPLVRMLHLELRAQCRLFVHGPLLASPAAGVVLRWSAKPWLVPMAAAFAEGLFARPAYDDGYSVRVMAGIAFPGKAGEVTLYGAFEAGNGRGLLVNRQQMRWTVALRYAPFTP
jgi:hypothetical protein